MNFQEQITEYARLRTDPHPCNYLPAQTAVMDYRIVREITPTAYHELLRRGWRRFGRSIFRPTCPNCTQCISLRLDLARFEPTRSQRRALAANENIRVVVQRPSLSRDHLQLFDRYHQFMAGHRGWKEKETSPAHYYQGFVDGEWPFAREFLYFEGDHLLGVALVDVLPQAVSSIYFFYDPEWRPRSPGVYSIMKTAEVARQAGARHQYLGYWVGGCPSLSYKSNYHPHERLLAYPAEHEEPVWQEVTLEAPLNS